MGSWHKLLKSKHCFFFNITLLRMKLWRWWCSRYLCNHGFLLCEEFQCLKFRYTEVIHKKLFSVFLKCTIVSDIYEHVHIISASPMMASRYYHMNAQNYVETHKEKFKYWDTVPKWKRTHRKKRELRTLVKCSHKRQAQNYHTINQTYSFGTKKQRPSQWSKYLVQQIRNDTYCYWCFWLFSERSQNISWKLKFWQRRNKESYYRIANYTIVETFIRFIMLNLFIPIT